MRTSILLGILVVITAAENASTLADDFRVETELFVGKSKTAVGETLTLFHGDLVYDYVREDKRDISTTVWDWRRSRFILLNHQLQIRTEITTDQLMGVLAWLARQVFVADDQEFSVAFDEKKKRLTVEGTRLVYQATGIKPKPKRQSDASRKYRDFADWYARLNATHGSNPPPFARIRLNEGLANRGLIPTEIQRTVKGNSKIVKSKHSVVWRLAKSDLQRIRKTGDQIANYTLVKPDEFWKKDRVAASK